MIIASDGAYEYAHNAVKEELQSGGAKERVPRRKYQPARKKAKGKARCDDITVIALNISGRARREQKFKCRID